VVIANLCLPTVVRKRFKKLSRKHFSKKNPGWQIEVNMQHPAATEQVLILLISVLFPCETVKFIEAACKYTLVKQACSNDRQIDVLYFIIQDIEA
jgi:hypothetical protein